MSSMTPYQAAKIVNARLVAEGIDKEIPPQMMYNYAKKNMIVSVLVEGRQRITQDGLQSWLTKYIAKLTKTTTQTEESNIDENQTTLF